MPPQGIFRRGRVWGYPAADLEVRYEGPDLRALLHPDTEIYSVVVRPALGGDHIRSESVRRANREWLGPWEATLPVDTDEHLPTWNEYVKRMDRQMRDGKGLSMLVEVDEEAAGLITLGAVEHGAMSQGILGYWIAEKWAGQGVTSLAVATVIDLVLGQLGLHRIEVNVRPENEASLGLCRKLGLREEGYKPRYMSIAGQWRDHVSFGVDQQDLKKGSLVDTRIRDRHRW